MQSAGSSEPPVVHVLEVAQERHRDEDVGGIELGQGARDAAERRAAREERALDLGRVGVARRRVRGSVRAGGAEAAGADARGGSAAVRRGSADARRGGAAVGAEAVGVGAASEQREREDNGARGGERHGRVLARLR